MSLKMATLSTLSACYWRLGKFVESINCMNLELQIATNINEHASRSNPSQANTAELNETYNFNRYRIYGNLASAYQRLNKSSDCLSNFQMQLEVALTMNDSKLTLNTLNSIGLVYVREKDYEHALEYFEKSLMIIEQAQPDPSNLVVLKLMLKQYSLIGEAYLKLSNYEMAKSYFEKQLEYSSKLLSENESSAEVLSGQIENLDEYALQECISLLNLALIESKFKNYRKSIEYNEKCLENLQTNASFDLEKKYVSCLIKQQVLELYGRAYIGLVNGYLYVKDNLRAALFAHSMLDFTLKELAKVKQEQFSTSAKHSNQDTEETRQQENTDRSQNGIETERHYMRRFKYLKFIEMSACSKLATCYVRQNRLVDAFKLHQREAALATQLNNTLYSTRAWVFNFNLVQFKL